MLKRIIDGLLSRLRNLYFRSQGMKIAGYAWLARVDIPRHHRLVSLGNGSALDRGVALICTPQNNQNILIEIGAESYINRHVVIDACFSVRVGKNCMIGPFCYITDHDHSRAANGKVADGMLVGSETVIEDDCWIGAHVTVLKGVTIGKGATVGAGSVVVHSIPAGSLAVGNPARVVRQRT